MELDELVQNCQKLLRSAIKNPPSFHNGNQMVLVSFTEFTKFEKLIKDINTQKILNETKDDDDTDDDSPYDLSRLFV